MTNPFASMEMICAAAAAASASYYYPLEVGTS